MKQFTLCPLLLSLLPLIAHATDDGIYHQIQAVHEPSSTLINTSPMPIESPIVSSVTPSLESVGGDVLADEITQALVRQDWAVLERLLAYYPQQTIFDQKLYDYAMGAMYRSQGKHKQAVQLYEKIAQDPKLLYPRFDLALMYFENKQYKDAKNLLADIYAHLPRDLQRVAWRYLRAIDSTQQIVPSVSFNFEQTDNVNNASDLRQMNLGGLIFNRDADSLPQSATGIRYDIGIAKQTNITGNHSLYASAGFDGVRYWDNPSFDEFGTRVDVGYRYADVKRHAGLTAYNNQTWLDDDKYLRLYGVNASFGQRLNQHWQASISLSHGQKRYENDNTASRHNGQTLDVIPALMYRPSSAWLYHFGVDYRKESLLDPAESSIRRGIRLGATYSGKQIGIQATIRHSRREFLAENFWYDQVRQDTDMQFTTAIWHKKLNYKGIFPKLNYRYQYLDSNLPLYNRKNSAWFMTVEKVF
ncbi:porin family protein [Moraxella sp. Pampa]|uniref:porin family protein n=1 Tax=Moraxella sp. Pampa TaxID=3111978 RepID=UPI002B407742|nr:porin family protein [Moraxella sp. Pampa]